MQFCRKNQNSNKNCCQICAINQLRLLSKYVKSERARIRDAKNSNMKFLKPYFVLTNREQASQLKYLWQDKQLTLLRQPGSQARAGTWTNGQLERASPISVTYAFNLYEAIITKENMSKSDSTLYFRPSQIRIVRKGAQRTHTHTRKYGKYEV